MKKIKKATAPADCIFSNLGWIDESGNEVNETIMADLGSLNPEFGERISEEAIAQCVDESLAKVNDKSRISLIGLYSCLNKLILLDL